MLNLSIYMYIFSMWQKLFQDKVLGFKIILITLFLLAMLVLIVLGNLNKYDKS